MSEQRVLPLRRLRERVVDGGDQRLRHDRVQRRMVVVLAEERIDVDDRRQLARRGVLEELAVRIVGLIGIRREPANVAGAVRRPEVELVRARVAEQRRDGERAGVVRPVDVLVVETVVDRRHRHRGELRQHVVVDLEAERRRRVPVRAVR